MLDGYENTQLNADGFIEQELSAIASEPVHASYTLDTPTGSISIFCEFKAMPLRCDVQVADETSAS
jgi:hypothetical protein